MSEIGVITIGRNEGERLGRCLGSLADHQFAVVYVDSRSTDGSPALARSMGARVVELDMSLPFSAARARNEGFEHLMEQNPECRYVQFVDGDCELVAGWIERARAELEARPDAAVVCGRRRERFPEASVYNRLADHEWDTPIGEADSCGGDSLMRVDAFAKVGGFDSSVAAGEEPELCQRLRAQGWKILRIDAEMTLHDSAMLRFSQWWKRAIRSGYGSTDVASRFGSEGLYVRQVRSARMWAIGYPAAVVVAALLVGLLAGWRWAVLAALVIATALPAQIIRLTIKSRPGLRSWPDGLAYATLTMLGKWAAVIGELRYHRDRRSGYNTRLIEYKPSGITGDSRMGMKRDPDWQADLERLPPRAMLREQSAWALWVYRFGRRNDRRRAGLRRRMGNRVYWLLFRITETLTGICLPKETQVGPGLRIYHFGNVFVHPGVKIGARCTLRQGVTLGNRHDGGPVPVLEDDVELGAYAQVLGGVRIGKGAKVGAMSVVLQDVPPGHTAVGIPARIIPPSDPSHEAALNAPLLSRNPRDSLLPA